MTVGVVLDSGVLSCKFPEGFPERAIKVIFGSIDPVGLTFYAKEEAGSIYRRDMHCWKSEI